MVRGVVRFCLALSLVMRPPLYAQAPTDPEVAKGIKQVEEGELDLGIFTLDAAARRLSANPAQARSAAQAYLYLGIAYLGKGQEMLAKTKFREAVQQARDLSVSADQFPPRVIELVEAARQEVTKSAEAPTPKPSPKAATQAPAERKGRSKLPFILLGGAAVGGGVALAGGGGSSSLTRTAVATPTPTPGATPDTRTSESRSGVLTLTNP